MKNKKGFTLIELLAVIVILGILLLIGGMSIDAIALRVRKNQHENLVKKIKIAAEKYFDDKHVTSVNVLTLIENGYLTADNNKNEIKSPSTGEDMKCNLLTKDGEEIKIENKSCDSDDILVNNELAIVYCFDELGTNCYSYNDSKNNEWQNGIHKENGSIGTKGVIYLRAYMVATGNMLTSGIGKIFKWINPINPDKVINKEYVKLDFNDSGYYNELFQLTYEENNKEYVATKQVKLDSISPICTNSGDSTTWLKGNRTIKWGCIDDHSQCDLPRSSEGEYTYSTSIKIDEISAYDIYDYAGNKVTCDARDANVYVDKTAPSVSISCSYIDVYQAAGEQTCKVSCSDSHSGIKSKGICKSSSSSKCTPTMGKSSITYYANKDWGRCGKCVDNAGNSKTKC